MNALHSKGHRQEPSEIAYFAPPEKIFFASLRTPCQTNQQQRERRGAEERCTKPLANVLVETTTTRPAAPPGRKNGEKKSRLENGLRQRGLSQNGYGHKGHIYTYIYMAGAVHIAAEIGRARANRTYGDGGGGDGMASQGNVHRFQIMHLPMDGCT